MTYEKREVLSPLLESENQIHLTIYLEHRGDLADVKSQIKDCLKEAQNYLAPVCTVEEQEALFQPIRSLLDDASPIKDIKGNIGLFRTRSSFRVLCIPVEVKRSTYVA